MHKQGETNWSSRLSIRELMDNRLAPFGDKASLAFASVSAIMALLPPPTITVLDAGCADGWLTDLLNLQGYDARGIDVCKMEINYALGNRRGHFLVGDFDHLPVVAYDAIVFNETLHHSVNRRVTLASAFAALKPGGTLIALEPGLGHGWTQIARQRAKDHDVTERSCPPIAVAWTGYQVGFRNIKVYPSLYTITSMAYSQGGHVRENRVSKLLRYLPGKIMLLVLGKWLHGITVMRKPCN